MNTRTVTVPNISCGHCTRTIELEVGDVTGVQSVKADEATKEVTIAWDSPASWKEIEALLREIDYAPAED
jgi:copper chaperone